MAEARRSLAEAYETLATEPGAFFALLEMGDKQGKRITLAEPFAEQASALMDFASGAQLVVHYKPRQIGDSTAALAWNFWNVYWTADPIRCLVAADSTDTTDALLPRIKEFHRRLPAELHRPLDRQNDNELLFADTGAGIRVLTAGGRSKGRGWTYQRLQAEELAFWPNDEESWGSVTSTMMDGPGSQTLVLSTPNGPGNLYHRMVLSARERQQAGDPTVRFRFFRWSDHAGYRMEPPANDDWMNDDDRAVLRTHGLTRAQVYWRHEKIHGPKGIGTAKFRRQYPLTLEDGFLIGEGCWFDADYLNDTLAALTERPGELRIYEAPSTEAAYCIGVDGAWCSTDTEKGGDNAVAQVLSHDGRQVATLATNRGGELRFAHLVAELAVRYGKARVLVEANTGGAGPVILRELQKAGIPLWRKPLGPGEKPSEKPRPWVTSHGSKEEGYAHLRQMVNGDALTLNDVPTVQELLHIREEGGTIEGRDGYRDDHGDALMLAEWNRRTLHAPVLVERWQVRERSPARGGLFHPGGAWRF